MSNVEYENREQQYACPAWPQKIFPKAATSALYSRLNAAEGFMKLERRFNSHQSGQQLMKEGALIDFYDWSSDDEPPLQIPFCLAINTAQCKDPSL